MPISDGRIASRRSPEPPMAGSPRSGWGAASRSGARSRRRRQWRCRAAAAQRLSAALRRLRLRGDGARPGAGLRLRPLGLVRQPALSRALGRRSAIGLGGGSRRACAARSPWGLSGGACYATDIGGFYRPQPDAELFVRWTQAAVFASDIRFHGVGPREPWIFGDGVEAIIRDWLTLRYRLIPISRAVSPKRSGPACRRCGPCRSPFQISPRPGPSTPSICSARTSWSHQSSDPGRGAYLPAASPLASLPARRDPRWRAPARAQLPARGVSGVRPRRCPDSARPRGPAYRRAGRRAGDRNRASVQRLRPIRGRRAYRGTGCCARPEARSGRSRPAARPRPWPPWQRSRKSKGCARAGCRAPRSAQPR